MFRTMICFFSSKIWGFNQVCCYKSVSLHIASRSDLRILPDFLFLTHFSVADDHVDNRKQKKKKKSLYALISFRFSQALQVWYTQYCYWFVLHGDQPLDNVLCRKKKKQKKTSFWPLRCGSKFLDIHFLSLFFFPCF
jgi:hypothetical protein